MNRKQTIRLNESQFNSLVKKLVKESVKAILNETKYSKNYSDHDSFDEKLFNEYITRGTSLLNKIFSDFGKLGNYAEVGGLVKPFGTNNKEYIEEYENDKEEIEDLILDINSFLKNSIFYKRNELCELRDKLEYWLKR